MRKKKKEKLKLPGMCSSPERTDGNLKTCEYSSPIAQLISIFYLLCCSFSKLFSWLWLCFFHFIICSCNPGFSFICYLCFVAFTSDPCINHSHLCFSSFISHFSTIYHGCYYNSMGSVHFISLVFEKWLAYHVNKSLFRFLLEFAKKKTHLKKGNSPNFPHQSHFTGLGEYYCIKYLWLQRERHDTW